MSKLYLAAAVFATFPFFLLLAVLSLLSVDTGWASLFLGCTSICMAILGVRRNSAIDLIFVICANWVVGLQLLSLLVWPEFVAYQDGTFYLAQVSEETVANVLPLLLGFSLGWLAIAFVDLRKIDAESLDSSVGASLIPSVVAWLLASVFLIAVFGAAYGVGVAGGEHEFRFEGILYYFFPADYLAVALACGLGFGSATFRRLRVAIGLVLALYLVVKLGLGWKSPILNVSLAYLVGIFYAGNPARLARFLPAVAVVVLLYALVVKPVADVVRTGGDGKPDGEVVAVKVDGLNPFVSRLTEGTLFSVAAVESTAMQRVQLELAAVGKDFVNRVVPGTIWDVKSIDRVFTEDVLGQPPGVPSTFAPGLIGMAAMLGGAGAGFWYGLAARATLSLVLAAGSLTRNIAIRFLVLGSAAVSTVSLSIDGYFGGIERLGVVGVVLFAGLLALGVSGRFIAAFARLRRV